MAFDHCPSGIQSNCPQLTGYSLDIFLTLINTFMATQCFLDTKSSLPQDYSGKLLEITRKSYDFIIIGGGTAGAVVANRLTENNETKVLLIEAGGYPSASTRIPRLLQNGWGTSEDWRYSTEPSDLHCRGFKGGRCVWPRGKVLGGTGQINGMLYLRGVDEDYREWVELGNTGWDPETVKKYFLKSENVLSKELQNLNHGCGGYLATSLPQPPNNLTKSVFAAAEETGYNVSLDATPIGFFNTLLTVNNGIRADTASAFLGPIRKRKNLVVALNSEVTKINFDGTKVSSVSVNINGIDTRVKVNKEVVVAAGAVNTPKLLIASGVGPKKHLEEMKIKLVKNLPVGQNLQDHFSTLGFMVKLREIDPTPQEELNDIFDYFTQRKGFYSNIGITSVVGFLNTDNKTNPNIQVHLFHFHRNSSALNVHLTKIGLNSITKNHLVLTNKRYALLNIQITLLKPKSLGKIKLNSKNPSEKPLIYPNYLSEKSDIEALLAGIKYAKAFINTKTMQIHEATLVQIPGPGCQDLTFDTRDYWICFLRFYGNTLYHPVGTCSMGPKGVVDERLRVRGVKRLRIVDGSVLPTIPSGNVNAPIVMVAEKGSDMIKEDNDIKV